MGLFLRILGGLIVTAIGFGMVVKTDVPLEIIGPVDWAETQFGPGGSRLFWKLAGTAVCLVGLVIVTGLGPALFMGTLGRLLMMK